MLWLSTMTVFIRSSLC